MAQLSGNDWNRENAQVLIVERLDHLDQVLALVFRPRHEPADVQHSRQ